MKIFKVILILSCISCSLSNCKLDKSVKEFYSNEQLKLIVDTIHGNLNGILKYYYPNGKIKSIQHWNDGTPSGDFLFFNEQGNIILHEKLDIEDTSCKLIMGNEEQLYNIYDTLLINFYSKYLKIVPDTGYYLDIDNYIVVKNIPNQLIVFDSNNGIVQRDENKWVAKIKTNERQLVINCYALTTGKHKILFTINKKVK